MQQLCGFLKQHTTETALRVEDVCEGRTRSKGRCSTPFNSETARRAIEAKFQDAYKKAYPEESAAGSIIASFSALILFLVERFGSLNCAMEQLDKKRRRRLAREHWEKGLDALGYQDPSGLPGVLGKIFTVLDQDRDSEITYEDVARYDPRCGEMSKAAQAVAAAQAAETANSMKGFCKKASPKKDMWTVLEEP